MPPLVSLTSLFEKHWTRSSENRSQMIKTFMLLLFMMLLLPTLGLSSITTIFDWLINNKKFEWRCLSDNGAFFIKYVTTNAIIGNCLDLIRLPDLFLYLFRTLWSRSSADKRIHKTAITFTVFCIILLQFYVLFFIATSNSKSHYFCIYFEEESK